MFLFVRAKDDGNAMLSVIRTTNGESSLPEMHSGSHRVEACARLSFHSFGKEDLGFPAINVHQFVGAQLSTTCGGRLLSAEPMSNS